MENTKFDCYNKMLIMCNNKSDLFNVYNKIILNDLNGLTVEQITELNKIYIAMDNVFNDLSI